MKDVIITIKGTQGLEEDRAEVIEFSTRGTLEKKEGKILLSYTEGLITTSSLTKTQLIAHGNDEVVLNRTGEIDSKLVIKNGIRNNCFYSVPQGDFVIGIFGKSIENNLTENGGTLNMSYTIDSNFQPVSYNTVEITVRLK